jgi:hypothetical protein
MELAAMDRENATPWGVLTGASSDQRWPCANQGRVEVGHGHTQGGQGTERSSHGHGALAAVGARKGAPSQWGSRTLCRERDQR